MSRGLLYTDAPEITGLANLPLGLALGLSTSSSTCRCLALLFVLLYLFDLIELYWRLNMSNISAWAHQESTEQRPSSFDELMVWAWAMIFSLEVRWLRKWSADHAQTWLGILDSHSAVIHVQWQSLHHIWLEKPVCYSCQIVTLCHTMSHYVTLLIYSLDSVTACHCPPSPLR